MWLLFATQTHTVFLLLFVSLRGGRGREGAGDFKTFFWLVACLAHTTPTHTTTRGGGVQGSSNMAVKFFACCFFIRFCANILTDNAPVDSVDKLVSSIPFFENEHFLICNLKSCVRRNHNSEIYNCNQVRNLSGW